MSSETAPHTISLEYDISRYVPARDDFSIDNPYLKDIQELRAELRGADGIMAALKLYQRRPDLVSRYSFSIPTMDILQTIAGYSPIVEIGAGSGYWAMCLSRIGADIVAYDAFPPQSNISWWEQGNQWFEHEWFGVLEGDISSAAAHPDRSLLLCWPPMNSPMAFNALDAYSRAGGQTIIYIGDRKSSGDPAFYSRLSEMRLLVRKRLFGWLGVEDHLEIYRVSRL